LAQQSKYLAGVYGDVGLAPPTYEGLEGLAKPFDWIFMRPSLAVSEAVGAARGGKEDVWDALTRGLRGYRRYPTLGHQLLPEAAEEGFQPADVGAFMIDVLADPTNLIPFAAAKAAVKPFAKGAMKLAKWMSPEVKAVLGQLDEAEFLLKAPQKAELAKADLNALGFKGPADAVGHIQTAYPVHVFPKDLTRPLEKWDDAALDTLRGYLRMIDANYKPDIQNSIQSFAQTFSQRVLPLGFTLKNFSHSGKEIAERWQRAALRAREGSQQWVGELDFLKKWKKGDRERMTFVIEGATPGEGISQDLLDAAFREDAILQRFGGVVEGFQDEFGDGMKMFDADTGKWEPFKLISGYFPHRWRPEDLEVGSLNKIKDAMRAKGMSERDIHKVTSAMGTKPKRVGHLEMKRHPGNLGYMTDPLEVLPKYFHDSLMRLELAREFGTDSRRLDNLISNLKREGFDEGWANKVGDLLLGNNIYERGIFNKLAPTLSTVQAVSKLGFSTTVANSFQGPINQYVFAGNFIKSLMKGGTPIPGGKLLGGTPEAAELGATAFGAAFRDDVYRFGTGTRSRLSEFYMKGIGFNFTERAGRHIGAIGGELDAASLYEAARRARAAGDPKRAGRFLSELKRKYRVDLRDSYDSYRTVEELAGRAHPGMSIGTMAAQLGKLPEPVLEHAGIIGADTIMHAFGPMDLPIGWRSPNMKLLMQFKSYIYKQMGFMYSNVIAPGIQYMATDGAQGSLGPLMRFAIATPIGAELVTHLRDVAKSLPSQVYSGATKGEWSDWEYKDPFWRDPEPGWRLARDMTYIGTFGIAGDVLEAASTGRLLRGWSHGDGRHRLYRGYLG
jgi:hypothetical protein